MSDGIQTFMDCTARQKKNTVGIKFVGCLWDKLDLYECELICDNKNCPRGYAR